MYGYAGRILYIDLSTGSIDKQPLDDTFARSFIGGLGFGAKIFLDLIRDNPHVEALSAHNPFVLMTGPLTGMPMHATARWTVCSKSPLTGLWGESNTGGYFGAHLKLAGYDGMVITGKAPEPVFIHIDDDRVTIREASAYWGEDAYTANDKITADQKEGSQKNGQVLTIGQAGENLVSFASLINNKGHAAGRCGMGAVWGAKKLKAVFVRGTGKLNMAHPQRFKALKQELRALYGENITIEALRSFGTVSHMDIDVISGDVPMKNWQQTEWDLFDDIGPIAYGEKMLTGKRTCYACGVSCKREAAVKKGPFKFDRGPGPEYETVAAFGTMCLNPSIESIGKANDICNRFGMDTITCGATIAFAMECFDKGLIDEKDTDGLALTWGNSEAIVEMAGKIGRREGFGAVLSRGSAHAAKHIGGEAMAFLTTVKGLEAPMHDPRAAHGYGLAYAVSPRGACHNASLEYPIEGGGMYLPEFDDAIGDIVEMDSRGKAGINIISQDFGTFFSSCAVFCNLGAMILNANQAVEMVNHVTGFDYTLEDVLHIGRRVWYLRRGLSNLFGAGTADDELPKRLMTALKEGPSAESVPDMNLMLKEFYQLRGLNANGLPEKQVLEKLALPELAELLHGK